MLTSVILEQNVLQKWNILFCGLYLLALKYISQLAKTFQVKVMITEIGVKQNDSASAQVLADFINKARDMESCAGVWYWEPECYEWNGYDMGAFDKNGKPTAIMNAFQSSTKRK